MNGRQDAASPVCTRQTCSCTLYGKCGGMCHPLPCGIWGPTGPSMSPPHMHTMILETVETEWTSELLQKISTTQGTLEHLPKKHATCSQKLVEAKLNELSGINLPKYCGAFLPAADRHTSLAQSLTAIQSKTRQIHPCSNSW